LKIGTAAFLSPEKNHTIPRTWDLGKPSAMVITSLGSGAGEVYHFKKNSSLPVCYLGINSSAPAISDHHGGTFV
jgi:hypothetical protein